MSVIKEEVGNTLTLKIQNRAGSVLYDLIRAIGEAYRQGYVLPENPSRELDSRYWHMRGLYHITLVKEGSEALTESVELTTEVQPDVELEPTLKVVSEETLNQLNKLRKKAELLRFAEAQNIVVPDTLKQAAAVKAFIQKAVA